MEIYHVPGHINVVPHALLQCADLATSAIINSDLLHLHHNLPLAGHLGVFWIVKALRSRYCS